jgi:hypothetical protein
MDLDPEVYVAFDNVGRRRGCRVLGQAMDSLYDELTRYDEPPPGPRGSDEVP